MTVRLMHNKVELALHRLSEGSADHPALLLLHGLGQQTGTRIPAPWTDWEGPVWGLDFTGHGASTVPAGGGYTCEILVSDVDIALGHVGPAVIVGRGLGAYVGLMAASARADQVLGLVLSDGPGLAGGSEGPGSATWYEPADALGQAPDPYALFELSTDVRPPDYATGFLRLLLDRSELQAPVVVTAQAHPGWVRAVINEPGVVRETPQQARHRYASLPS